MSFTSKFLQGVNKQYFIYLYDFFLKQGKSKHKSPLKTQNNNNVRFMYPLKKKKIECNNRL